MLNVDGIHLSSKDVNLESQTHYEGIGVSGLFVCDEANGVTEWD